ncbi:MAG: hypothetical protein FK734_17610 [Asgard group archaeon]|nr:hypothetical protein [Asgard group archaeon]
MNTSEKTTLWDALSNYQRRNPESVRPPSERIDPDVDGAHFWVIIVKNWEYLHPLIQDVLYVWYKAITHDKSDEIELDPTSTEALVNRLEVLDEKLKAFDLERTNLEQELSIRDRDFQRLRSLTGKREKENIEVQQMLGQSFQEKIMQKQDELDRKDEYIRELEKKVDQLINQSGSIQVEQPVIEESNMQVGDVLVPENLTQIEAINHLKQQLEERTELLRQVGEQLKKLNEKVSFQNETIKTLEEEIKRKDEKIKEIKGFLQI